MSGPAKKKKTGQAAKSSATKRAQKKAASHGGARPGAGRKPRGYAPEALTIRCKPEVAEKFRAAASAAEMTQEELFEELLAKAGR